MDDQNKLSNSRLSEMSPPQAKKIPHRLELHGDVRFDDYYWLRDKQNPSVIAHLNAENAYTEKILAAEKPLRESLFEEMKARIKQDDSGVPYRIDEYFYYSRMVPGQQYAVHCRKHGSLSDSEEVLLDENVMASGLNYFNLGVYEISPDHRWLAYAIDTDGSEKYSIYFKNLQTGQLSPEVIPLAHQSLEWAEDSQTVFYTLLDANERPDRLLRHRVGEAPEQDTLLYRELDPQLFVYCSKSRSRKFIFLELHGKVTTEIHFLQADNPTGAFQVIEPRRRGILYSLTHHDESFYIVTNDVIQNFRLVQTPVTTPGSAHWQEKRTGSEFLFIEAVETFRNHLIIHERERGLPQLRVLNLLTQEDHLIEFPEPTYHLGAEHNPDFNSEVFRFSYTSLVTPQTVYDYQLNDRSRVVLKQQEIPSGYDASQYRSEWRFAKASDGVLVPISLVYKVDPVQTDLEHPGARPLYLYGYGSYGMSMYASFSSARLSLLNRGFIFAIAHVRGGSELGRAWYENGKFLNKKNTFTDFIRAAEFLIEEKYTEAGNIVIAGGSAGGMLVGAAINLAPELFKAAVAKVPFVDVLNTMLDSSLPLTTIEYEEWGNPTEKNYYDYIKSYSPYDNVEKKSYPHLLVTSGLNDPRVTYWEPAKWVAKLREHKSDSNLLLQHINMLAGHGGASGRYDYLKEIALEYAFVLKVFGIKQ
jgi:oligopeptidase B